MGDVIHRLKYDGWIAGDSVQAFSVHPFPIIEVKCVMWYVLCRPMTFGTFPSEASF